MTTILRDAECELLDPAQKAQYWANLYQDAEKRINQLTEENRALRRVVDSVRESVLRA